MNVAFMLTAIAHIQTLMADCRVGCVPRCPKTSDSFHFREALRLFCATSCFPGILTIPVLHCPDSGSLCIYLFQDLDPLPDYNEGAEFFMQAAGKSYAPPDSHLTSLESTNMCHRTADTACDGQLFHAGDFSIRYPAWHRRKSTNRGVWRRQHSLELDAFHGSRAVSRKRTRQPQTLTESVQLPQGGTHRLEQFQRFQRRRTDQRADDAQSKLGDTHDARRSCSFSTRPESTITSRRPHDHYTSGRCHRGTEPLIASHRIGPTYVHSCMDGEALRGVSSTRDPFIV